MFVAEQLGLDAAHIALRKDHGPQIELLHDVHHRLRPIEDPTPAEDQESLELIRRHQ